MLRNLLFGLLAAAGVAAQYSFDSCPDTADVKGTSFPRLIDVTLEELETGLESGLFTSVDLVTVRSSITFKHAQALLTDQAYIARINEMNSTLHMVTELNPDALSIAAELDSQRAAGNVTGPLHGIPILIKNNIATHDLINNTAGSFALLGSKVPRDSTVAAKLRAAGVVILGKVY